MKKVVYYKINDRYGMFGGENKMEVKIARIRQGLTQLELCKIVNTSPKRLVEIERGNYNKVTFELAYKIAKALDTTVQELFFSEEER